MQPAAGMPMPVLWRLRGAAGVAALLLLAGCAGTPVRSPTGTPDAPLPEVAQGIGKRIVDAALAQLGRPYRYGGGGPDAFDCSGLVQFVHAAVGVRVPRTTAEQFRLAEPVPRERLAPGDLLFFRIDGRKVAHVGIYVGAGRFVHAPQTGRPVELRAIADEYYQRRLLGVGRFTGASGAVGSSRHAAGADSPG